MLKPKGVRTIGGSLQTGSWSSDFGTLSLVDDRVEFRAEDGTGDRTILLSEITDVETRIGALLIEVADAEPLAFQVGGNMTDFTGGAHRTETQVGTDYRDSFVEELEAALRGYPAFTNLDQPLDSVTGFLKRNLFSRPFGTLRIDRGMLRFQEADGSHARAVRLTEILRVELHPMWMTALVIHLRDGDEWQFTIQEPLSSEHVPDVEADNKRRRLFRKTLNAALARVANQGE